MEEKANPFRNEPFFRKFISAFKPGARIIDIGSAGGQHVPLFLGIGRHLRYEGLDISRSMLRIARRRFPQLTFHEADILDRKNLPKKRYDGFWAAAVLMHIPEPLWPEMLENISTLVKPGATGYITLPRRRPQPESRSDRRTFTFWNTAKLKRFLAPAGWRLVASGNMQRWRRSEWRWYIVRLPKKAT